MKTVIPYTLIILSLLFIIGQFDKTEMNGTAIYMASAIILGSIAFIIKNNKK